MIKPGERVFVDSGAWIAAAVVADAHHEEAAQLWNELLTRGGKVVSSVPVVIETFTYLQRGLGAEVARAWRTALLGTPRLVILDCTPENLAAAWPWMQRRELHKLGLVDATSFALMKEHKLRRAFSFDTHFATAGFKLLHA